MNPDDVLLLDLGGVLFHLDHSLRLDVLAGCLQMSPDRVGAVGGSPSWTTATTMFTPPNGAAGMGLAIAEPGDLAAVLTQLREG